jgi:signal transduction histidine kinase
VDHAAGQLRGTVWSLRSLTADGRPFGVALRELVDRTAAGHDATTSLALDPAADDLPPLVSGNLLLVLQEALHNALHHAEPKTVAVEVRADEAGSGIVATVRDDGCGFTLGEQVGPAQGHFGLDGMRERVERIGGTLEIKTAVGAGTTVRADVPLRQSAGARPPARPPLAAAKLNETPSHDRTMSASG